MKYFWEAMILYLDQFAEREVVELEETLTQDEASALLADDEFHPSSKLHFEVTARKMGETIRVVGSIVGTFDYECGRCLSERSIALDTDVELVFLSRQAWEESLEDVTAEDRQLSEEDMDVVFYSGKELDLNPELREAILLELPTYALCTEELKKDCDKAYQKLVAEAHLDTDKIVELEKEEVDERWSALKDLKIKMFGEKNEPEPDN